MRSLGIIQKKNAPFSVWVRKHMRLFIGDCVKDHQRTLKIGKLQGSSLYGRQKEHVQKKKTFESYQTESTSPSLGYY